jgi:hypothetical protein
MTRNVGDDGLIDLSSDSEDDIEIDDGPVIP